MTAPIFETIARRLHAGDTEKAFIPAPSEGRLFEISERSSYDTAALSDPYARMVGVEAFGLIRAFLIAEIPIVGFTVRKGTGVLAFGLETDQKFVTVHQVVCLPDASREQQDEARRQLTEHIAHIFSMTPHLADYATWRGAYRAA